MRQLSRALGLQHALDVEGKLRLVAELKAHYRHGLKFGENTSSLHVMHTHHLHQPTFLTSLNVCVVFILVDVFNLFYF